MPCMLFGSETGTPFLASFKIHTIYAFEYSISKLDVMKRSNWLDTAIEIIKIRANISNNISLIFAYLVPAVRNVRYKAITRF